jgi:hypothetical protein
LVLVEHSSDDDVIDVCRADVRHHGLERGQVGVNVEEARDAHVDLVLRDAALGLT